MLNLFFLAFAFCIEPRVLGKGLALCVLGFSFAFEHERIVVWSRSVKRETFTLSGSSWDVSLESLCLKESEWKESFNSVIRSGDQ